MHLRWVATGALAGVFAGLAWGWLAGGSERGDSALGTGFLCGLFGALVAAIAVSTLRRRDRRPGSRGGPPD